MVDPPAHRAARPGGSSSSWGGMGLLDTTATVATALERRTTRHGGGFVEAHKTRRFLLQTAAVMLLFGFLTARCATAREFEFTEGEANFFRKYLNDRGYDAEVDKMVFENHENFLIRDYLQLKREKNQFQTAQLTLGLSGVGGLAGGGGLLALASSRFLKGGVSQVVGATGIGLCCLGAIAAAYPIVMEIFKNRFAPWALDVDGREMQVEQVILKKARALQASRDQAAAGGA